MVQHGLWCSSDYSQNKLCVGIKTNNMISNKLVEIERVFFEQSKFCSDIWSVLHFSESSVLNPSSLLGCLNFS